MANRESGDERLYPKLWGRMSARYYYLIQLRKQMERVIKLYISQKSSTILADYGCGNKPYEPIFRSYTSKYIGIDLADNLNADVIVTAEGNIEMPEKSVDIVLSTQVLEHVENPTKYLEEAERILKEDGLLILSTHGYWMFHPDPTDYWRWTSSGLKKIITSNGFEICYFEGILGRSSMGLQLFQDGVIFKIPKFSRKLVSLFFQILIILFDKINSREARNLDACTFVIVAKKKA